MRLIRKNLFITDEFKMTEWKHGDEMILSKNENYWDADSIKLDEICVKDSCRC